MGLFARRLRLSILVSGDLGFHTVCIWDFLLCGAASFAKACDSFVCGTCDTRQGPACDHIYIYKNVFFSPFGIFFSSVVPGALGSGAHREPVRTQYASLGPGRGPWHVLWGLKGARPLGEAFQARRAIQAHTHMYIIRY